MSKLLHCLYPFIFICSVLFIRTSYATPNILSLAQLTTQTEEKSIADAIKLIEDAKHKSLQWSIEDQAKYYHLLARFQENNNNIKGAENSFSNAITLLAKSNVSYDLVFSYLERSYMRYLQTNNTEEYCPDRATALKLAKQLNQPEILVKALSQYLFCFNTSEKFADGINIINQAIDVTEKHPISAFNKNLLFNAVGIMYRDNQLHELSYQYFLKALEAATQHDNYRDSYTMLYNLISASINLGNWSQAHSHISTMESYIVKYPADKDFLFFKLLSQGKLAMAQSNFQEAVIQYSQALTHNHTTTEQYFVIYVKSKLAEAHARLGQLTQAYHYANDFEHNKLIYPQDKAILSAISAAQSQNTTKLLSATFALLDIKQQQFDTFLKNQLLMQSRTLDNKINTFEKEILAQKLAIKDLELTKERDLQKISQLTLTIGSMGFILLILIIVLLRRNLVRFKVYAQTDHLTKEANRRYLFECGDILLSNAIKEKSSLALIGFDIDHFKKVNDQYGHDIGDKAIVHVVQQARKALRKGDLLGRIGGEEFMIILPDTTLETAKHITERLLNNIRTNKLGDQEILITVSAGLSSTDLPLNTNVYSSSSHTLLAELIKQTDIAMYNAKKNGRDQFSVYNNSMV